MVRDTLASMSGHVAPAANAIRIARAMHAIAVRVSAPRAMSLGTGLLCHPEHLQYRVGEQQNERGGGYAYETVGVHALGLLHHQPSRKGEVAETEGEWRNGSLTAFKTGLTRIPFTHRHRFPICSAKGCTHERDRSCVHTS